MTVAFRILLLVALSTITWLALAPDPLADSYQVWDKLSHWMAFITLAFLADYSFPLMRKNWIKWISLAVYGLGLEVVQQFSGYRYFELFDVLADSIGIICYVPLRGIIQRIPVFSMAPIIAPVIEKRSVKNQSDNSVQMGQ